ncbi:MAG: NADH-quinone oxidoreductase subunit J [Verrucomicrobiae bacterium]|nr:NADH-quinone oxidoreductase subunit J [Verrucomicrobiae bacterium]
MELGLSEILFWVFSALAVAAAFMVMMNRNPVASALCLVLTMVFVAALMILLGAFFLGTIQILVYAGAVMVLFLFIIMLLNLKAEAARRLSIFFVLGGLAVCGVIGMVVWKVVQQENFLVSQTRIISETKLSDVKVLGKLLFSEYLLPFQLTGVLLLVAMVGVILLCGKEQPSETSKNEGVS